MKLIQVIVWASILMLITGAGMAAKVGPIEMRNGANITLISGWVRGASFPNGTAAQDAATYSQAFDNIYNVRSYGAVGDGTTDDSAAIRSAMNAAPEGSIILFPPKYVYKANSAINPTSWKGRKVFGYGATIKLGGNFELVNINKQDVMFAGFTILAPYTNTAAVINLSTNYERLNLRDISMNSSTAASGEWTGLKITGHGHQSSVENIKIKTGLYGIIMCPVAGDWITDVYFGGISIVQSTVAVELSGGVSGNVFNGVRILHTKGVTAHGIHLTEGAYDNMFDNVVTWYDSGEVFTAVLAEDTTHGNIFSGGAIQGFINDSGTGNIFQNIEYRTMPGGYGTDWIHVPGYTNIGTRNFIQNGNCEIGSTAPSYYEALSTNTVLTRNAIYKYRGSYSLKVAGKSAAGHSVAKTGVAKTVISTAGTVTAGAWVMAPSTNSDDFVHLVIEDGLSQTASSTIPADNAWHWITVQKNLAGLNPGYTNVSLLMYTSNVGSSDDVSYWDGIKLCEGPVCSPAFVPYQADA